MQEIVLILSSLAGVATAAAVRKMPRDKNQLLNLGASSHIKTQISSIKIEKEILTKTISRLYQADSKFTKIQKDKLLLKYQHQLGIVLAKLEKLDQASNHPDLGPVGDGLITLMDQKLSKLDERLYEISSKMATVKVDTPKTKISHTKQKSKPFESDKPRQGKIEPVEIPATAQRRPFEITTLTNIPSKEVKFTQFGEQNTTQDTKPKPKVLETETLKPDIGIKEITPTTKIEDKIAIVQSTLTPVTEKPDITKQVADMNKHVALPEPPKETSSPADDDFEDDSDNLDKIKGDIMKVLSKLDQAEVE